VAHREASGRIRFSMIDLSASGFIELVAGRRGHFEMESGYHSSLWLDLDALFADPERVRPFVSALANSLRPYRLQAVCGPLLGGAFLAQSLAESLGAEFWYTEAEPRDEMTGMYRAQYRLPAAFVGRAADRRVAVVDDVMSAGSSLRATDAALRKHSADVVVAGALLILGDVGAKYFADQSVPVESVARGAFEMWAPADCPHCVAGVPVERVG
jgi:orotate phosphoribosyltransferase